VSSIETLRTRQAKANAGKVFRVFANLQGHTRKITCVALSPDRKLIASVDLSGAGKVWDLETGDV
jgi:WD40 repeat protein